ncbi:PQQ-binding-like beta-propeller repeat protein [Candidatus Latescibacterota bacterium]
MSSIENQPVSGKQALQPLRLWPGVVIVLLQWILRFGLPLVVPGDFVIMLGILGGMLGGIALIVWWAFFSRAPKSERWGAVILIILAMAVTSQFLHESIAQSQAGITYFLYAIPPLCLAFVVWAVSCRHLADRPRRAMMIATILLSCGAWTLVRTVGMTSDIGHDFTWRWTLSPEEQFLAQALDEPLELLSDQEIAEIDAEWPGFRGQNRDAIITGISIKTDWSVSPPIEMWRRPIGPGLSSFAIHNNLLFTQEQIGENEVVSCYQVTTGKPVWRHHDAARFIGDDANLGPRATPTYSNDRVFSFGATGILNALDARDGSVIWSRNGAEDAELTIPIWGFSSSPLVVDDMVIVAVEGVLIAYDIKTGNPRWFSPNGGKGYSSPHLMTIDNVVQVVMTSGVGATSFSPADGKLLWEHPWEGERIIQPHLLPDGDLIFSDGAGKGLRRIALTHEQESWNTEELWTTKRLRPNFNDIVIHKGHAYGFNKITLTCIDIEDGKSKWNGERYGGQLLLLADQDLLVVLSEKGELALVEADPGQFTEIARFTALEGKTWNHPVLTGDILVVRNNSEMVAFRLSLESE